MPTDVGIVVIGRNEGERLRACLSSVAGKAATIVYVDSGSTDSSVAVAKEMGTDVVVLNNQSPFTAARGRNAGFERIQTIMPNLEFVQFIDGDCDLIDGWLEAANDAMKQDSRLAAVCGRRQERFPQQSIYNAMMDLEWDTPIGPARSVGGDAMFRASAFKAAGGFNAEIAAGEEPELCLRLRQSGWKILRLDCDMTRHDANLLSFSAWWKRQVRSGRGAMDVARRTRGLARGGEALFPHLIVSTRRWTIQWLAVVLLVTAIVTAAFGVKIGLVAGIAVLLAVPVQMVRIMFKALRRGYPIRLAAAHGFFTMIGKWAMLIGQVSR